VDDHTLRPGAEPSTARVPEAAPDQSAEPRDALDALITSTYAELRGLARRYMRGERHGHLLQTTALVNEAYLRLTDVERMRWQDRTHFVATAATLMRRILVDAARARQRQKRGGGLTLTSIEPDEAAAPERAVDVLALDEALTALALFDERQCRLVELRFFGGLTIDEVARALDISPATVGREWLSARAWLRHYLTRA
jgi:RNA polymerase sigma-70 factor (ECF subfamily)